MVSDGMASMASAASAPASLSGGQHPPKKAAPVPSGRVARTRAQTQMTKDGYVIMATRLPAAAYVQLRHVCAKHVRTPPYPQLYIYIYICTLRECTYWKRLHTHAYTSMHTEAHTRVYVNAY